MFTSAGRPRLHPLLAGRFSPYAFDSGAAVDDATVELLLEAARWAPSAGNSQPWSFYPVRPGEVEHKRIAMHLAPSSARWALDAGLLIVTLTHRFVDDSRIPYSEFADYDLGQAVANLTIQAQAIGLACHQFRAFDLDAVTTDLAPTAGWVVMSMIAVGVPLGEPRRGQRLSIEDMRAAPWNTDSQ
ncbi:nitroreductase family protein [Nocardia sp. NPDC058640]|uniref:nitroreductase family protein n=1 Tax=Nocardia sp. NPDC058640 TaxID=3346571 RepID=UPI00365F4CBA